MTTKSTDLVTIDGAMSSDQVVDFFGHPDRYDFRIVEDPVEVQRRIEAATLAADSAESLFGAPEVLHARDILGKPYQFLGVEWRPSDIEGEGLPFFGVFKIADAGGEIHLLSCGARSVVLKAARAEQIGLFPRWLKIVEVQVKNPVKGRQAPLDLVAADPPVGGAEAF